jgi:PII-like signaling protein
MELPRESSLLRIFIGEDEKFDGKPAYEAIVMKARELNMAGATVTRGILGFGKTSRIHAAKVLEMSGDLPVVVEIVDTEDKLNNLLPVIEKMHKGGMVTMEKVKVLHYKYEAK